MGYSQSSYEIYAIVSAMPSDITKYSQSEQSGKSELFTIQYRAEEDVSSDNAKIQINDSNAADILNPEANKLYSVYLLKDGTIWYHEEAKSNADKQIVNLDMSKYIVESGVYTWTLLDISNNKELARTSKSITLDAKKLSTPDAPSVELNGKTIHYFGEYANENAGSLWIYAYYTTKSNQTYLLDKKLNLISDGKYDGTIDLNRYYLDYSKLNDMVLKIRILPKDSQINTISDFSGNSKAISISGLSNNNSAPDKIVCRKCFFA